MERIPSMLGAPVYGAGYSRRAAWRHGAGAAAALTLWGPDRRPDLPVVVVDDAGESPIAELRRPVPVTVHVDPATGVNYGVVIVKRWFACDHPERPLDRAVAFHIRPDSVPRAKPCTGCVLVADALARRDPAAARFAELMRGAPEPDDLA